LPDFVGPMTTILCLCLVTMSLAALHSSMLGEWPPLGELPPSSLPKKDEGWRLKRRLNCRMLLVLPGGAIEGIRGCNRTKINYTSLGFCKVLIKNIIRSVSIRKKLQSCFRRVELIITWSKHTQNLWLVGTILTAGRINMTDVSKSLPFSPLSIIKYSQL